MAGRSVAATTRASTDANGEKKEDPMHDREFRPCGPGKRNKTLGRFPSFMADPPKRVTRTKKDENAPDIPPFKSVTKIFSRPTPSVATNFRNMKASFPMHFTRR